MKVAVLTTDNREHFRDYGNPNPYFGTGPATTLQGLAQLRDIEVHIISCACRQMRSPEKIAPNTFFHSVYVPKRGWLRTLYLGCIRAVRQKLREINPDIAHGMGTERDCSLSAVLSGYPNVVTIHGNMRELCRLSGGRIGSMEGIYYRLAALLEDFTLRRATGVICHSRYTEDLARSRSRRTWLVPHALRREFFAPIPETSRPCVLLNIGVISPRKRQLELLDIVEELHKRGLKFEFHFIGVGSPSDYANRFEERIKTMELAGYARYVGAVSDAELIRRFDSAAALVHFPTEEAFGNVVIESLGRGLKFFGSRLGGIVDIASDIPGAELFEKDDWSGLTNAIEKWIAAGHTRPDGAAPLIWERYRPETIARRHVEIYREVLEGKAKNLKH